MTAESITKKILTKAREELIDRFDSLASGGKAYLTAIDGLEDLIKEI